MSASKAGRGRTFGQALVIVIEKRSYADIKLVKVSKAKI